MFYLSGVMVNKLLLVIFCIRNKYICIYGPEGDTFCLGEVERLEQSKAIFQKHLNLKIIRMFPRVYPHRVGGMGTFVQDHEAFHE